MELYGLNRCGHSTLRTLLTSNSTFSNIMGCGPSTIAGESQGEDILNDIDRGNVLALGNSPPTTSDEPFASVNENLKNKEIEVLEGDSNIAEAQK